MRTTRRQPVGWLFPEVRTHILSLLLTHAQDRWYLQDIVRRSGCAVSAVHRELKGLVEAGIIERTREGNRTYYQANKSCPIFAELSGLMRKTAGLADVLHTALSDLAETIDFAFIYGSQADGTAVSGSDVDLLVVGEVDEMALHRAVSRAEEQLARPVNYTLLTRKELARRRKEKGGFLARVLNGQKIPILGDVNGR